MSKVISGTVLISSISAQESQILTQYSQSMIITSLYTSISHNYEIEAILYWIDTYPETINNRFSKEFIIEGLLFVLENNVVCFSDEYFQQLQGTAMGTNAAPTYSTLTVGYMGKMQPLHTLH